MTMLPPIPGEGPRGKSPVRRPVLCQLVHTLNVGGAELLARKFAEAVRDRCDVVFVCLDSAGVMAKELATSGLVVEVVGRKPGFDLRCAWRLRQILGRHQVDLVHAHQYAPFFYAMLSRRLGFGALPIIFTEHGRDYPDYPRPKRKIANRLLLRRSDRVIGVGNCVRDALIHNEGLPPDRVEVIYNGVDVARYDPRRPLRNPLRAALGLTEEQFVVMQVARLDRLKDHPTALHAMAQLVGRCPKATLVLVGDGEERPAIERLIGDLGLRDNVRLLGTRSDVPALLQAADVFLLSSISEGIPLTIIEAMATGLPCVATRVGGNAEVVAEGQTGLLAESGDAAGLAGRLVELVFSRERAQRLGAAGRSRAEEHFSDRQMHARYDEVYRSALAVHGRLHSASSACQGVPA